MTPTQRKVRQHLQRQGAWAATTERGLVEILCPGRHEGTSVRLMTTTVQTIATVAESLPCEVEVLSVSPLRARWKARSERV